MTRRLPENRSGLLKMAGVFWEVVGVENHHKCEVFECVAERVDVRSRWWFLERRMDGRSWVLEVVMVQWLRDVAFWFWSMKYFLIALVLVAAGCLVPVWSGAGEAAFRLSGLMLQVSGMLTVFWGIEKTRRSFGLKPVWDVVLCKIRSFPMRREVHYISARCTVSANANARCEGYKLYNYIHDSYMSDRVDIVEHNLTVAHDRISGLDARVKGELLDIKKKIESVSEDSMGRVDGLSSVVKDLNIGGIHISLMGAAWILVGCILSTASVEMSYMLQGKKAVVGVMKET